MPDSNNQRTVRAYFAAMRRGPEAEADMLALFASDASYHEPFSGAPGPAVGAEAISERLQAGWATPIPDMELEILGIDVTGNRGESRWECRSPVFPAPVRGRDTYEFRDGLITSLKVTIDETEGPHMPRDHIATTRGAYSDSALRFATAVGTTVSAEFEAPIDLAILTTFATLVDGSSGVVVDAGCGTGRVARYLADSGLDVLGVDVAPGMIAEARRAHPDIAFHVAELTSLPSDPASVAAVAYWYSIITTPPDALSEVWSELSRVLAPGGAAVLAFQSGGGEHVHLQNAYGTTTDLTLFRHDPDHVRSGLEAIGLSVHATARRRPQFAHETTDQAFIIATDTR